MNKLMKFSLVSLIITIGFWTSAQTTITTWDFDGATTAPSTGNGTIILVGGTSATFASGVSGDAYNTNNYPNETDASGTAGVEIAVSTVGYENITIDFQHRASGTASRWAEIQYSTDAGLTWNAIGNNNGGISPHNNFYPFSFDFSTCASCNDNADFKIRIVSIFSPFAFDQNASTTFNANEAYQRSNADSGPVGSGSGSGNYSSGGTWRFDDITISGDVLATPQVFYANTTGDLNDLATWGDQTNGTGVQPNNFTDPNQTFHIVNNPNPTISGNWEVTGIGSKVILGNGVSSVNFTVPQQHSFQGEIDLEENSTLSLHNAIVPNLGNIEENTTVSYSSDANNVSYANYFNLLLDNIDPVFSGNGDIYVKGDLTLLGTVNMPDARGADEYSFVFEGTHNQTLNGNGNFIRAYNIDVVKTDGDFSINGTLSTDNQLTLNFSQTANFLDLGNDIHVGNSLNIAGDSSAYMFTGTVILDGFQPGLINGAGNGNNFNIREGSNDKIVAALNNVIIRAVNQGGEFRFRAGGNNLLSIKGDFTIEEQVEGDVRFYSNNLSIGGDFEIENNFLGGFNGPLETMSIVGNSAQNFSNGANNFVINNLTLNNDLNILTDLAIENTILLNNGLINCVAGTGVYLTDFNGISGGSMNSYIDGPLYLALNNNTNSTLDFSIGKNGAYRPVQLNITQDNATATWYSAEVIDGSPATSVLGTGIDDISNVRYYEILQDQNNQINAATLTLAYDVDDNVTDVASLRIAQDQNGTWENLGGIGTNNTTGTISSTLQISELGAFILAVENSVSTTPEIIASTASLNNFVQILGTPSPEISFTVQGLHLVDDITINAPANFEISTTSNSGFDTQITLSPNNGIIGLTTIYVRLNAAAIGNYSGDLEINSLDASTVNVALEGVTEEPVVSNETLIYYWHFNNMDPDADDVKEIDADFSLIPGFTPKMVYTGESNRDMDVYDPGSALNLQMNETEGFAARVRNESEGRSLLFDLNTTGCSELIFEYAVHRSGSGMLENIIEYSVDGGVTFSNDFLPQSTFIVEEFYELVTVDFTDVMAAEDNPNFVIKITWQGNTQQLNGNNRYDNITLKGVVENVGLPHHEKVAVNIFPNPARDVINISSNNEIEQVIIYDMLGNKVMEQSNQVNAIAIDRLPKGVYMINILSNKELINKRFIKE